MAARFQDAVEDLVHVRAVEAVQTVRGQLDPAGGGDLDARLAVGGDQPGQTALFLGAAVQGVLYLGDQERDDRGQALDVGDVDARLLEGLAYGGTFLLGDRAAEGDGTVRAQFVGGDVGGVLGDLGADADDAQGGGEFGQDGGPGADQQDPAALAPRRR